MAAASARLATIDLGTNTVRLLVADVEPDGHWRPLDQDQRITRLGEGLSASGHLGEAPMRRTAATVEEYVARARRAGAGQVRIVATSAVREAVNGRAFTGEIARRTNCAVDIVSGDEEARLTVLGVLHGLPGVGGTLVVFDIGGGSTEYIVARGGAVDLAASLCLGVVPLAERYPFPDPVDWRRYAEMERQVTAQLVAELPAAIRGAPAEALVGTAGTVTTLAALDLGLRSYDPARVQGHRLSRMAIEALRARLGALPMAGRAALPCLEPGRADLIMAGIAIVTATMTCLAQEVLITSDWGLREGLVVAAIAPRRC